MVMLVDERTIIASAVVVALIAVAIATLAGLHIRSRALARVAEAKAQSANEQVSRLRTTLDNQQLADAIAAEAHDTLAHSLSLLALNASALQAESRKLKLSRAVGQCQCGWYGWKDRRHYRGYPQAGLRRVG